MKGQIADLFASLTIRYWSGTRITFYEGFQNLVENGLGPNDALKELNKIWSNGGRKPDEPLAIFTRDLMVHLIDGMPLSKALARWVPYEEASLIEAGGRGARISQACDDVVRTIEAQQQIRGAVATALAYPVFLLVPLNTLLWMVADKLIPQMAKLSDPETWSGSSYALYQLANLVTNYGALIGGGLLAAVIAITFSLSRWTGALRMRIDGLPIYSTYRMIHGSTFLLNMAVMMRAGIGPDEALKTMGEFANPWLKERISAARHGLGTGVNLGVALENTGHNFPDKRAIQFIRILAAREGFPEAINRYSTRWLSTSIKQLQRLAQISLAVGLIMIGAVMGLVVSGSQDMQNNVEKSATIKTNR